MQIQQKYNRFWKVEIEELETEEEYVRIFGIFNSSYVFLSSSTDEKMSTSYLLRGIQSIEMQLFSPYGHNNGRLLRAASPGYCAIRKLLVVGGGDERDVDSGVNYTWHDAI